MYSFLLSIHKKVTKFYVGHQPTDPTPHFGLGIGCEQNVWQKKACLSFNESIAYIYKKKACLKF